MKKPASSRRIFLVERDRLENEAQLDAFQDLQGYTFWVEDRIGRPPRTIDP